MKILDNSAPTQQQVKQFLDFATDPKNSPCYVAGRLAPGQATDVVVTIRPQRRGCYRLRPPVCESSFPFNLFHFGRARDEEESLIVLPAFSLLDVSLPYVSRHVDASSIRPAGRMGTSPEYIGNRPYQPGDPPRRIDVLRLGPPVRARHQRVRR